MKSVPIILIGFGVGFLLYNLQVISFTPWQIVWPSLIIWLASSQLGQIRNVNGAARTLKLPSG